MVIIMEKQFKKLKEIILETDKIKNNEVLVREFVTTSSS